MLNKLMDLHNHTDWADGAHYPEEIIENAIKNGVSIIGISDHFDTVKCNSVCVAMLDQYIFNLKKLKNKYKNQIQVLAGVEICMNREWCDLDKLPYDKLNKLDYVLFEYIDWFSDSVTLKELKEYAGKITCKKGLAHTNLITLGNIYGLDEVIKIIKENDLFWELNVNPGYEYFDEILQNRNKDYIKNLFNRLKENEIKITVGSDTHSLFFYDINNLRKGNELAQM